VRQRLPFVLHEQQHQCAGSDASLGVQDANQTSGHVHPSLCILSVELCISVRARIAVLQPTMPHAHDAHPTVCGGVIEK
jgi:hypothetical protein